MLKSLSSLRINELYVNYPVEAQDTIFVENLYLQGVSMCVGPNTQLIKEVHLESDVHIMGNSVFDGTDGPIFIGARTKIEPGVFIVGPAKIGPDCKLRAGLTFRKSICEGGCDLKGEIENCMLGQRITTRPGCVMFQSSCGDDCEIGAEVRRSILGSKVKAVHQNSYLGDAIVGDYTNFASGSMTLNFKGSPEKEITTIGRYCFIGAGNLLVAPIVIGNNVATAASLTIRANIPNNTFVDPDGKHRPNKMKSDGQGHWVRDK